MNKKYLFISIFILSLSYLESGYAACTIENGPPAPLLEYMTNIRTELTKIRSEAGSNNNCNGKNGTFSNERRFIETMKRLDEAFSWQNIIEDFIYNVEMAADGQTRGPVTAHGKLWKEIEKQAVNTMRGVSEICALDSTIRSGGTPESRISSIIDTNRKLERYFWQITRGDTSPPQGLDAYTDLTKAITLAYSPEMTRTCKGPHIAEDIMQGIMDRVGKLGESNKKSSDNWKDAIALFRGDGANTQKYIELQRRLLEAELARQGLSTNAKKAILRRMSCLSQRIDEKSTPEEISKRQEECKYQLISGADTITKDLGWPWIRLARTTDEFLARTLKYDALKNRTSQDLTQVWSMLENEAKVADEATNEKIMNDLVAMHYKIITTTEALRKAIPKMYKNCTDGVTSIPCPKPR